MNKHESQGNQSTRCERRRKRIEGLAAVSVFVKVIEQRGAMMNENQIVEIL
jgi:hypothetical protein